MAGGGGCAECAQAHPIFGAILSKDLYLFQKNLELDSCVHTQYLVASAGPELCTYLLTYLDYLLLLKKDYLQ